MKKYFSTGLAILLPILLTGIIVIFLINFFTSPFTGAMTELLYHIELFQRDQIHPNEILFISKILVLILLAFTILLIGVLGKFFLIDYFFGLGNRLFYKVPYINRIYKACQDVVHGLFSPKSSSFSQVVLVPFPSPGSLSIGLVAKELFSHSTPTVSVFVPGTPNPSMGFMLTFKREQVIFTDMKIDEAMKYVVSCGVVLADFTIKDGYET